MARQIAVRGSATARFGNILGLCTFGDPAEQYRSSDDFDRPKGFQSSEHENRTSKVLMFAGPPADLGPNDRISGRNNGRALRVQHSRLDPTQPQRPLKLHSATLNLAVFAPAPLL